jgi:GT2 family glycosyltransferase
MRNRLARPLAREAALRAVQAAPRALDARQRPVVRGKFFEVGGEKLWVRGVTYGGFRANGDGVRLPEPGVVARDLDAMAARGIDAVRVYARPPRWLLDLAQDRGLRVMAGLDWTQHVAFLESRRSAREIEAQVREGARALAGHPALLCYAIGNEIPAPLVRWHGRRRIERFLAGLHGEVKAQDPDALVTYVSYPSTEYLELPFLDFASFNVYLETRPLLAAYLARLQNLVGERPLVLTELGMDSLRHGERTQAETLAWQLRETFEAGCAGSFVFGWTAEWHTNGCDVLDWDFGLTTRERRPKPALGAVQRAYAGVPPRVRRDAPRISVVVCSFNGAATIRDTLEGLARVDYPNFEVIVVDDGSTDATAEIARGYDVTLLSTPNQGLGAARNVGLGAATGEIVAYLDDDAYPDPQWLTYLALSLRDGEWCGVGGPNLLPPEDGEIAECVANSPGGPAHVLLSDRAAEHIPGCNMAFRKSWLEAVGGFDPRYRAAGDDVDVCWSLQERGGALGFHPAALVWHHRRSSLVRYWRQQVGYGKAEALLAAKWPQKYNSAGHIPWSGRIYGRGLTLPLFGGSGRVYQGIWGSAPFQSIYEPARGWLGSLPLLPEWYLLVALLGMLTALGTAWSPLLFFAPSFALAAGSVVAQAVKSARRARLDGRPRSRFSRVRMRALIALLHLVQPAARLWGRLRHGLRPWRARGPAGWRLPRTRSLVLWSEQGRPHAAWLEACEAALVAAGALVRRGGEFDRFDLVVAGGPFGAARTLMAVEEHGGGRQYVRFRVWPKLRRGLPAVVLCGLLAAAARAEGAWLAGALLAAGSGLLAVLGVRECGCAQAVVLHTLEGLGATAASRAPRSGRASAPVAPGLHA